MKYFIAFAFFVCAGSLNAQVLNDKEDSLSYALGVIVAQNLQHQGIVDFDEAIFTGAIKTVLAGENTILDTEVSQNLLMTHMDKKREIESSAVMEAGIAFLEENAKRPEVTTLESGLQYEVLKEGDGPKPNADDEVKVHYHGTLIDGTIFDSSVERGEPTTFPLNRVIKGWTEILQHMPAGSKWRVFIPYDLAYGDRGAGPQIKPYSTLIFEIELLDIM